MPINIFNLSKASCSSKVPGFSSVAPKADSLVDKVLKLFMAIILALVSAVKYSEGLITSSFKGVKPKTTIEKLAFAANATVSRIKKAVENQSTIIKIVIAAAAVTGAVYAYRSYNIETPTQPDGPKVPVVIGGVLATALFGALGIVYATTGDQHAKLRKALETALETGHTTVKAADITNSVIADTTDDLASGLSTVLSSTGLATLNAAAKAALDIAKAADSSETALVALGTANAFTKAALDIVKDVKDVKAAIATEELALDVVGLASQKLRKTPSPFACHIHNEAEEIYNEISSIITLKNSQP